MFIHLTGFGQKENSHQLTITLVTNDYYRMHRLWNKMVPVQDEVKRTENILPNQDQYIIKDLKPGNCMIMFYSVFGDVRDTNIYFDKRIGLKLKYDLPNYQADQVSMDSIFTARLNTKDTLYLFYNIEGCFGGNDQGLITVVRDENKLFAILDDKIYDHNSKIIQSNISLEDLGKVGSLEYMLKYLTDSSDGCTSVTYYTFYKDGKVKFGKDGTCSKNGIEALKEILFDKK